MQELKVEATIPELKPSEQDWKHACSQTGLDFPPDAHMKFYGQRRAELNCRTRQLIESLTELASLRAERDRLREALVIMLASAHPRPVDHPSMTAAWKIARAALAPPVQETPK
jgi:hypothetical protein